MGSRISVSAVAVIRPPMTTMASGRWISEPGPLANSSGTRPKAVMLAVISTGRSRRSAPSTTTPPSAAARQQLVEVAHQHHAVEHGDAQQRDEADRGRHRQVFAGQPQAKDAADHRERDVGQHQQRLAHRAEGREQQEEDQPSATGTTSIRRAAARCWFSNWPPQASR
jgi:hypothetical protein